MQVTQNEREREACRKGREREKVVCVTGGSGYLASYLIMHLLNTGYTVRATTRDPDNKWRIGHLESLPGALEHLSIVKVDLLDANAVENVLKDCQGVFHVASPLNFKPNDPQKDVIKPTVEGVLNVLKACTKIPSIKRVVYTSSVVAMRVLSPDGVQDGQVFTESNWASLELLMEGKVDGWAYCASKTLAERSAIEFSKKHNIDLVTIAPSLVIGPFFSSEVPASLKLAISCITGPRTAIDLMQMQAFVHVDDVTRAHILLYETPSASGRYICSAKDAYLHEITDMLNRMYPDIDMSEELGGVGGEIIPFHYFNSQKLVSLGFKYNYGIEDMYRDAVTCCQREGGFVTLK